MRQYFRNGILFFTNLTFTIAFFTTSANPHHASGFVSWYDADSVLSARTSCRVFFPTSFPTFQALNACPWPKTSSISSSVRCAVSGKQKIKWMAAAKLNAAKMKYVFHAMCDRAGGTAHASAKLNAQLVAVASETALPRTRMGKISAGYVHETGPIVTANEQTNRYEQTMMPLVTESWPEIIQTDEPSTVPHVPYPPWRPPTRERKKPISKEPAINRGRRPQVSMYRIAGTACHHVSCAHEAAKLNLLVKSMFRTY